MKALEILKEISTKCETDENFMGYTYDAKKVDKLIQESIVELEEAMKHKTCEGCSNLFFDEIEKVYKCSNDVSDDVGYLHGEAVIRNIKDFHCVQHQPKDNA